MGLLRSLTGPYIGFSILGSFENIEFHDDDGFRLHNESNYTIWVSVGIETIVESVRTSLHSIVPLNHWVCFDCRSSSLNRVVLSISLNTLVSACSTRFFLTYSYINWIHCDSWIHDRLTYVTITKTASGLQCSSFCACGWLVDWDDDWANTALKKARIFNHYRSSTFEWNRYFVPRSFFFVRFIATR